MDRRVLLQALSATALLPFAPSGAAQTATVDGDAKDTVYELRVYHAYDGKLGDLLARFRNHTMRLFEKHGMRNVAYWTPLDPPLQGRTLFYVLGHRSREAATASWQQFQADPDWIKARDASEANGKLVEKVDSTFLSLTDFSPRV